MDILNMVLAIAEPKGVWESIIRWLQGGIGNYALTIIVLTLALKVIMLPLDFWQRYSGKVNAKQQAKLQPEMDKLKQRYGHDQNLLNQKTQELYKREGYNVGATCLGMFLNLVITSVVFFTLFSGINKMQYYKVDQEYITLQNTYIEAVDSNYEGNKEDLYDENGNFLFTVELTDTVKDVANKAVVDKYYEIRTSFLWIKNVWIPDNWSSVIPDYEEYLSITKQKELSGEAEEARKLAYNTVMQPLSKNYEGKWNGYMILPVISIGLSMLSTFIPNWMEKAKYKKRGIAYKEPKQNKTMILVLPLVLGGFTLFYNAVFALYIVTGSLFGVITSPLMALLTSYLEDKKALKTAGNGTPEYSRRKPVDITENQVKNTTNKQKTNSTSKNTNKNSSPKSITKAVSTETKKTTTNKNKNKQDK